MYPHSLCKLAVSQDSLVPFIVVQCNSIDVDNLKISYISNHLNHLRKYIDSNSDSMLTRLIPSFISSLLAYGLSYYPRINNKQHTIIIRMSVPLLQITTKSFQNQFKPLISCTFLQSCLTEHTYRRR